MGVGVPLRVVPAQTSEELSSVRRRSWLGFGLGFGLGLGLGLGLGFGFGLGFVFGVRVRVRANHQPPGQAVQP